MQPDPHSYRQIVWPRRDENLALNDKRGIESRVRLLEDREELVGAGVHLASARFADGVTEQLADIGQHPGVAIAKAPHQAGGVLDVGEQESHQARRQCAHFARASLDLATDAYVLQLARDEADGHDPVFLGGLQQPRASPISGHFVLEGGLVEPRQRVADVGLVVDRQAPAPARIDVREGAVGQQSTGLPVEIGHGLELP